MTNKRTVLDRYAGPWTAGIDVSAYQPGVDWPTVARSSVLLRRAATDETIRDLGRPLYAVVRLADGIQTRKDSDVDPWAVRHLTGAHEAGLLVASYHYLRAHHDGVEQAELALEAIRVAGVPCPWVGLDFEFMGAEWAPKGEPKPTTDRALEQGARYARRMIEAGIRPVVYTGIWWHEQVAQRRVLVPLALRELDLWTAYYTSVERYALPVTPDGGPWPWAHAEIWQAGGGGAGIEGRVGGIRGPIDANRFRGDEAALREWWGKPASGADRVTPVGAGPLERAVDDLETMAARLKTTHPVEADRVASLARWLSLR